MERTYIINYTYPLRYRGTYVVKALDGIEAGRKLSGFLHEKYGVNDGETENSIVTEVYEGQLIIVG
jgi:hypothetical protein